MKTFTVTTLAGLAALAHAVEFTNSNFDVEAGEEFPLTWSGAEGEVTITLRRGDPNDLDTVEVIGTVDGSLETFTWDVPDNLESGDDYALEISDESGDGPNYSPQFPLEGDGTATPSESASDTVTVTSTVMSSASSSSEASATSSEVTSAAESSSAASSTEEASSTVSESASESEEPSATESDDSEEAEETEVPDSKAGHLGSPVALICFTIAAMLYFH